MNNMRTAMLAAGSALCLGSTVASAIELTAGDWTLNINGNVNVHYINNNCDESENVAGGITCNDAGSIGDDRISGVTTGLLPGALVFNLGTTQQDWSGRDWDLNAVFGFYPGVVSNDTPNFDTSANFGLESAAIDTRQVYLKFANADLGSIKMGRDFGLFGYDAIINDMTLPGVGVQGFQAPSPNNTTLGSIGYGYIYTDTLSQINYTTPTFGGVTITGGIFQPLDALDFSGTGSAGSNASAKAQPGFHGQVRYDLMVPGGVTGFLSVNGITQEHTGLTGAGITDPEGASERSWGVDVNAVVNVANFSFLGSYYTAEGMGTTGLFFDAFDENGKARDSDGFLLQGTATVLGHTKLGVNYGVSNLDANSGDPNNLVEENRKWTVGVYHTLTTNLMLLAEYSNATSENQDGDDYSSSNINVGAFMSF